MRAIRKNIFKEFEGFNQKRYNKHSIEDIELGYRICERGYQILLDKRLQVKHLKRWEFAQMISTDIFLMGHSMVTVDSRIRMYSRRS